MTGPDTLTAIARYLASLAHLGRVAFWVLLALWTLTVAVRLAAAAALHRRLAGVIPGLAPRGRLAAALLPVLVVLGGAAFLAARPDERFHLVEGRLAMDRGDYEAALAYYEPLARWGTDRPEVYENLALVYIGRRRFADALPMLREAQLRSPSFEAFAYAAHAHLALGEVEAARAQLAAAAGLVRGEADRRALAELEARAGAAAPGGR